ADSGETRHAPWEGIPSSHLYHTPCATSFFSPGCLIFSSFSPPTYTIDCGQISTQSSKPYFRVRVSLSTARHPRIRLLTALPDNFKGLTSSNHRPTTSTMVALLRPNWNLLQPRVIHHYSSTPTRLLPVQIGLIVGGIILMIVTVVVIYFFAAVYRKKKAQQTAQYGVYQPAPNAPGPAADMATNPYATNATPAYHNTATQFPQPAHQAPYDNPETQNLNGPARYA
ncbi:hypothetical protein B0H63DRAFT_80228, partial [Podospora didyma]